MGHGTRWDSKSRKEDRSEVVRRPRTGRDRCYNTYRVPRPARAVCPTLNLSQAQSIKRGTDYGGKREGSGGAAGEHDGPSLHASIRIKYLSIILCLLAGVGGS